MNLGMTVLYCILVTLITGFLTKTLWCFLKRYLERSGYYSVLHKAFRIVLISYLFPIGYFLLKITQKINFNRALHSEFISATPVINIVVFSLLVIYLLALILTIVSYIDLFKSSMDFKNSCIEVTDNGILDCYRQCYYSYKFKLMPIPKLYVSDYTEMALVTGLFRTKIILPPVIYTKSELEIIFNHELGHIRNHDVIIRYVIVFINCLHLISRKRNKLTQYYTEVSEIYNDLCTCRNNNYSMEYYYSVIVNFVGREPLDYYYLNSHIVESKSLLTRRIEAMKRIKNGKIKRSIALTLTLVFVLTSSFISYAAGSGLNNINSKLFYTTSPEDTDSVDSIPELTEYTESEFTGEEYVVNPSGGIVDENSISIQPFATNTAFSWPVPKNTSLRCEYFTMSAGSTITVMVAFDPAGYNMKVGIIKPDGSRLYVASTGTIYHTFTCSTSGTYAVYVTNENSVKITATGVYVR